MCFDLIYFLSGSVARIFGSVQFFRAKNSGEYTVVNDKLPEHGSKADERCWQNTLIHRESPGLTNFINF